MFHDLGPEDRLAIYDARTQQRVIWEGRPLATGGMVLATDREPLIVMDECLTEWRRA